MRSTAFRTALAAGAALAATACGGNSRSEELAYVERPVENIYNEVNNFYQHNAVRKEVVETRNMAIIAIAVIRSALMRKESRGAHFLIDNPERNDNLYLIDTII